MGRKGRKEDAENAKKQRRGITMPWKLNPA